MVSAFLNASGADACAGHMCSSLPLWSGIISVRINLIVYTTTAEPYAFAHIILITRLPLDLMCTPQSDDVRDQAQLISMASLVLQVCSDDGGEQRGHIGVPEPGCSSHTGVWRDH